MRGFTWTASLDALGRQAGTRDPLGRRTALAFDARSLISQRADGKGQVWQRGGGFAALLFWTAGCGG